MTPAPALNSLKALAEAKTPGINKTTIYAVDPRRIEVEHGFNGRIENDKLREHIDALKTAFRAGATFPPLDVRIDDGRIIVVDGHCRRTMALELIAEGVEIRSLEVRQFRGNDADRVAHMAGSAQSKPLTPLEQGHAYLRLRRFGWSIQDIANRVGRSSTHVTELEFLAQANQDVQDLVAQDKVSAAVAIDAVRKHGDRAGEVLASALCGQEAKGKTKVTAGTLSPSRPKPAQIRELVGAYGRFVSAVPYAIFRDITDKLARTDLELAEETVTVPALAFRDLLAPHIAIDAATGKSAE